ncbi:MAG: dihydrolipoyl dehydrogenase [Deltaproteobacteria bacterium]|nr:MAG: dihydrolipoyl dehydrogenase [Deltaproteobacteria bacterium]
MARAYQAVVVGGGPGGYVAGIRLGQLGVKAAVIEKARVGGVCLNWGCIPSKALIHVAKTYTSLGHGEAFGLSAKDVKLDISKTRAWKDGIVAKLTGGVAQLLRAAGTEIIEGEADFAGPGVLTVKTAQDVEEVRYEQCIIAAGARPIEIPGFAFDGKTVWSAKQAVDLPEIPKRLVVIGGGIIGLELGTVYAKLGTAVTVVEMTDGILPGVDPELIRVVSRKLKKLGVEVLTGAKAKGFDGKAVTVESARGEQQIPAERVLVAVGFRPNSDRLSLAKIGVQTGKGGAIPVDERMQTNVPGVYAVGDITGAPYLAHRAFKQGEVAAEVIAGRPAAYDVLAMPSAIFTDPEIASTGMTEAEAKAAGHEVKVGKFMLAANGRALGTGETDGFVKAVVDAESGTLLGLQAVGVNASEIISEGTLGIEMGAVALDLGLTVHPHPSISEAVQEAVLAAIGEAIHAINRKA